MVSDARTKSVLGLQVSYRLLHPWRQSLISRSHVGEHGLAPEVGQFPDDCDLTGHGWIRVSVVLVPVILPALIALAPDKRMQSRAFFLPGARGELDIGSRRRRAKVSRNTLVILRSQFLARKQQRLPLEEKALEPGQRRRIQVAA